MASRDFALAVDAIFSFQDRIRVLVEDAELTEFAICNFTGAQRAVSTYWKLSDTRALFRAGGALGNAEVGDELWRARRARERELFLWVRKRKERRTELG